jgi:hypothetical protein
MSSDRGDPGPPAGRVLRGELTDAGADSMDLLSFRLIEGRAYHLVERERRPWILG